ncbi:TolC family protein [Humisphaera borealis]|uniref:TolC family protein n=1 Tax=Humisphaera borealis TaxID=2807512 RepID=A0A7M2WWJ7_9BACT|nr:TolC family protein [Humisphaera borealis]QOV89769.1 TolC family protein [Humisphaera borealis]
MGPDGTGVSVALATEGFPDDQTWSDDPAVLPLTTALRHVLETDPKLQQSLARVRIAEAEALQARLLPNPVLTVVVRFREGGGSPIIAPSIAADLIAILRKPRQAMAADHALQSAAADALATAIDLIAETRKAYVDVQAQDALLEALRERSSVVRRMVAVAKARLEAGDATRLDLLTLQGQQLTVEQEIADAALERQSKRLILLRLLGHPSGDLEYALDPLPDAPPETAVKASEAQWMSAAMNHRPEIEAIGWNLAALGDQEALAAFFPWDKLDAGIEAERDSAWSVGPSVALPLPLFDTGDAAKQSAFAKRVEARHKLTAIRRQVLTEVRISYRTFIAAGASLTRVREQLLPVQVQRRDQIEAAYKAGEVDLASLLLADNDVNDAREKLIELRHRVSTALTELERSVGGSGVAQNVAKSPADFPSTGPAIHDRS